MTSHWWSLLIKAALIPMPWFLKRPILQKLFGYEIHPSAKIGFAWVFPSRLRMEERSHIDHLTVAVNLEYLCLHNSASIGRCNWITGFPLDAQSMHFAHQPKRNCQLVLEEHASITKNHHVDCTSQITIGAFATIAGYGTQILTHSIDLDLNRQSSSPIYIGKYTFVGTRCVILGGSVLPDYSVLAACSLLNKSLKDSWSLYAGQPARFVRLVDHQSAYFCRTKGFVW